LLGGQVGGQKWRQAHRSYADVVSGSALSVG
jgi:hypothetical protein